jgi:hypothetical protein
MCGLRLELGLERRIRLCLKGVCRRIGMYSLISILDHGIGDSRILILLWSVECSIGFLGLYWGYLGVSKRGWTWSHGERDT